MITGREYIAQDMLNDKGYVIGHACREDIVRCKDCKHYQRRTESTGICGWLAEAECIIGVAETDYCCMAERKEE